MIVERSSQAKTAASPTSRVIMAFLGTTSQSMQGNYASTRTRQENTNKRDMSKHK